MGRPQECGWEVAPLPEISPISIRARKVLTLIYLSSLLLFRCCDRRPHDVALGGTSSLSCRAVSHTPPAGQCRRHALAVWVGEPILLLAAGSAGWALERFVLG